MIATALWTFLFSLLLCGNARAADVTLTTKDGQKLHAVYETPAKTGIIQGVVLVHGDKRSANDWKFLVTKLSKAGFQVIAPDLRGHGANVAAGTAPPTLTESQYQAMIQDVTAAMDYLRSKGVKNISLMGATLGANLALQAGAGAKDVTNMVMLSPGLTYQGVTTSDALARYGDRPILMVVSKDDGYAAKSALVLEAQAKGKKHLEIYTSAGSGAVMLNREPGLEGLLLSWLLGSYDLGTQQTEGTDTRIDVGSDKAIETTGDKLFQ